MKAGFRDAMTWLHTWGGLVTGWLLVAVFVTGTTAFFRQEITYWMEPELHAAHPAENPAQVALDYLQVNAPQAARWDVTLPSDRSPVTEVRWAMPGQERQRGGPGATLDPATGDELTPRETAGGNFLYRFHFELYGMPRITGRAIIGIVSMVMLIALVTAVVIHKKIFTDFFTFRRSKAQRGWLDAHVITGVFALPFHIMITFSGLILLAGTLVFWNNEGRGHGGPPPGAAQGQNPAAMMAQQGGQRPGARSETMPDAARGEQPPAGGREGRGNADQARSGRGEFGGARPASGEAQSPRSAFERADENEVSQEVTRVPLPPIVAMIKSLQAQNGQVITRFTINNPQQPSMTVEMSPATRLSLSSGRGGGSRLTYDAQGNLQEQTDAKPSEFSIAGVNSYLDLAHQARFASPLVRWLYFIAGVCGTLMVITGLLFWTAKRAKKQTGLVGYELVSGLNLASTASLLCALATYFWANRLLPAELIQRELWEVRVFLIVWAVMAASAIFVRHGPGWKWQLGVTSFLFLTLPIVDSVTSSAGLWFSLSKGDWVRIGFDLMAVLCGSILLAIVLYLQRRMPVNRKAPVKAASGSAGLAREA